MNKLRNKGEDLLQKEYIQKSKIFLLPLTEIKRNRSFPPSNTYTSSPSLISDEYPEGISNKDMILIVSFSKKLKQESDNLLQRISSGRNIPEIYDQSPWEKYEITNLFSNRNFLGFHETEKEFLYTFKLSHWSKDWKRFIEGRYSLMTEIAKDMILRYKDLKAIEKRKLLCYLYPYKEEYLSEFSADIEVPMDELKEVKELCSKPDLELETFKCETEVKNS